MRTKINVVSAEELHRRKIMLKAITDYFGAKIPEDQFNRILKALKSNSTAGLEDEDRKAVWSIRTNLDDETYCSSLAQASGIFDVA